jgi:hypothetical protein
VSQRDQDRGKLTFGCLLEQVLLLATIRKQQPILAAITMTIFLQKMEREGWIARKSPPGNVRAS